MSIKKTNRMELRLSEEDKKRLKDLSMIWESSEAYAIRRAIKEALEKETVCKKAQH